MMPKSRRPDGQDRYRNVPAPLVRAARSVGGYETTEFDLVVGSKK
jgi:hypothetical protein